MFTRPTSTLAFCNIYPPLIVLLNFTLTLILSRPLLPHRLRVVAGSARYTYTHESRQPLCSECTFKKCIKAYNFIHIILLFP
jgi:hypothetical protein